tara:strand:- start:3640 stop:4206 length:567 start_codon:yes stop_codon:yes gene_type:complete
MASSRRGNKNNFDRGDLDKKVDQFIEVGRQLVDGVAGTRPGTRKRSSFQAFSRNNVKNVGNWVNDKLDFLFEDDEDYDWNQSSDYQLNDEFKSFSKIEEDPRDHRLNYKRPLNAISLRIREKDKFDDQKKLSPGDINVDENWEEESFFRVNKWQRSSDRKKLNDVENIKGQSQNQNVRNLPRSRRRRS